MPPLLRIVAIAAVLSVTTASALAATECDNGQLPGTFAAIQTAIFDRYSCTDSFCHGDARSGGLDLRPEVAYDQLVDAESFFSGSWTRVVPGQAARSLMWLALAGKTDPASWESPMRTMPLGPLRGITLDELEALRLWIEYGAPRDGVVPGTGELLNACLPPPELLEINPLPVPAAGRGVQIPMPPWQIEPDSEREICFATYYDITDQVPVESRSPDGASVRYRLHETRQSPLSHHLALISYDGRASVDDPSWGGWSCRGGELDGRGCAPRDSTSCGDDGYCVTPAGDGAGCVGYGPGDAFLSAATPGLSLTQETAAEFPSPPGVFEELPLRGILLWSSHAFNLLEETGTVRAWANFEFAPPEQQSYRARSFAPLDEVFEMVAPAYSTDEPCRVFEFPENAHVFEWSSHTHKRGKRWRTFLGDFRCDGGAADGEACSPLGYDFDSPDVCQGAPCRSRLPTRVGDCDLDGVVGISELVLAVSVALGRQDWASCSEVDGDRDFRVTVSELVTAVRAALNGVPEAALRDPQESLFYVSHIFDDPLVLRPREPTVFSGSAADRSVTYCSLYDNGFQNPGEVKRRSTSVLPAPGFPGGPCEEPTHCAEGRVGETCSGAGKDERDRSCDTAEDASDGLCDACPLIGGITTDDDMFLLMGRYYVPARTP